MALRGEEGEQHPSPDEQGVHTREQMSDHAELVGDLRTAEHHDIRPLGVLGEPIEHVELGRDQLPCGAREQLGQLVHARLLAVDDAEAIAHERIAEFGESRRERLALRFVLARLPRIEPEVLEEGDVAVLQTSHGLVCASTDGVAGEGHRLAQELAEALCDRGEAVPGVRCAFGAAEVRDHDDPGALVDQGIQRGNRRSHTAVVRDLAVLEGNVQVTADDDTLAGERTE